MLLQKDSPNNWSIFFMDSLCTNIILLLYYYVISIFLYKT